MIFSWFAAHLAVGGLFSLLFVTPSDFGKEFHRFSGLMVVLLMGAGLGGGALQGPLGWGVGVGTALWVFLVQWGRLSWIRPSLLLLTGLGVAALLSGASASPRLPILDTPAGFAEANALAAAVLLGSVSLAMLLGHWYLVIPGLHIRHLQRLTNLLGAALLCRSLLMVVAITASSPVARLSHLSAWRLAAVREGFFFWSRVGIGLLLPALLTVLTDRTVRIQSTQSATGLLYVVVVLVLIGEMLSRFLYVMAGIPQ